VKVAYFFLRFPVSTQTFLQREVAGVAAHGVPLEVHSILADHSIGSYQTPPGVTLKFFRPWQILRLPFALWHESRQHPDLFHQGWTWLCRHRPDTFEKWFMTLWGAAYAVCQAESFRRSDITHFHGAWATAPATAAAILSYLTGRPFSFGAHAYDVYRHNGDPFLKPKLLAAHFVHTTTEQNIRHFQSLLGDRATQVNIVLSRRGLDFLPEPFHRPSNRGPIHLLSVARLVEKKGHLFQIGAARLLKNRGLSFHLKIVGDGPLRAALQHEIDEAGLRSEITLVGAQNIAQIREAYREADIFWHTGIVDAEGDRDGLPNVIPEAFAFGLPVISCAEPGATEAVHHEKTGLVVTEITAENLAQAVKRLAHDPILRQTLGQNGRAWVEENFLAVKNSKILAQAFAASEKRVALPVLNS
jgi:glycosyltransferase involved in cell wall biosynthesis